jgi:hypothetical protein
MSNLFVPFLAVVVDTRSRFALVSGLSPGDSPPGGNKASTLCPGDIFLAGSDKRSATGLERRLRESGDKIYMFSGDTEGIGVSEAFKEFVLDVAEQAYQAGKNNVLD